MKNVLNVGIGGKSFVIDEDAYQKLSQYLDIFRRKTKMGYQTKEVMDDLEIRIAELLSEFITPTRNVVNLVMVNKIISQLGMPDGVDWDKEFYNQADFDNIKNNERPTKTLFRDPDNKVIGGVCSGFAAYFDIEIMIIRIVFLIALLCGSLGFWLYVIFWIVTPLAKTAANKCQMRGLPVTIENMRRYSNNK